VHSTLLTHVRSSPPSGFLSCLDWLSVCLLVGKGDDVTPCPAPCPRVRAPELSIWRSKERASAAVSWVQDSMTWLSSPLPRNVKHSEAALSASKGVENLKTRGEEMRGMQVTQRTRQDNARIQLCHTMRVLHAVEEGNMRETKTHSLLKQCMSVQYSTVQSGMHSTVQYSMYKTVHHVQ
jgi:hypothetical protein